MWPKHTSNQNLPRQPELPSRWGDPEVMSFNGIIYNNLLHEQEARVDVEAFIAALEAFCESQDIKVKWRKMKNHGIGGWERGRQLSITMNRTIPRIKAATTLAHEIVHCLGHVIRNAYGNCSFRDIPHPVMETEAYLVEYRVFSFFFPAKVLYETPSKFEIYNYREDFNSRLYHHGPKQNVHMIRDDQCVEFADNLILWLLDWLIAEGEL